MTRREGTRTLYDPRRGDPPIRLQSVRMARAPAEPPRTNYFSIYFIEAGSGTLWADSSQFAFQPNSLLFFVPYQHLRFDPEHPVTGTLLQFHANFLCVETFHAEVGCSGILFNDPYGSPIVSLEGSPRDEVRGLMQRLRNEQAAAQLAHDEAMLAYLKLLLILASRLKEPRDPPDPRRSLDPRHPVLTALRELIELHYCSLHSPTDYARRLHLTPKTLGRIVREHLGTTPTDLIRNRILVHAKWQLLHTLKPVKEIARELGFSDELYFSRLFKKATGYSPTFFREFETAIRGGSNLSMFSTHAPILPSSPDADT